MWLFVGLFLANAALCCPSFSSLAFSLSLSVFMLSLFLFSAAVFASLLYPVPRLLAHDLVFVVLWSCFFVVVFFVFAWLAYCLSLSAPSCCCCFCLVCLGCVFVAGHLIQEREPHLLQLFQDHAGGFGPIWGTLGS